MKRVNVWRESLKTLVTTLFAFALLSLAAVSSVKAQEHRETFIIYANVGPSIPVGNTSDEYKVGFHGGGGIGIALSHGQPVSLGLVGRLEYEQLPYRFPHQESYGDLMHTDKYMVTEDNSFSASLELKIRYRQGQWLQPYFTGGIGIHGYGFIGPNSLVFFGIGTVLFVDRSGIFSFYTELKYLGADLGSEGDINLFRLDIGIRLG